MDILDVCATRTLECGVVPIEIGLRPMYDCYYSHIVGYRGSAYVNSILYGTLGPADYADVLEHEECGVEFARRNLRAVARALPKFSGNASQLELVSLRCPVAMLDSEEIYDVLRTVGRGIGTANVKKMCLEFSEEILRGDATRLNRVFADVRAAGWKIAVANYGAREFPMASLAEIAPDAVYMRPEIVAMLGDREKSQSVSAFVRFAASLGVRVIADGPTDDGQIRELSSAECFAYMPSPDYVGNNAVESKERDLSSLVGVQEGS